MATRQNKRRSTTFAQRTNAHLKAIERKLNPQPTFGPISVDPPAITNQGRFIDRTIFVTTANDKLTIGDISRSLKGTDYGGSGPSGDFYIRNIKIWGAGTPNVTLVVNFILANLLISGGTNADPVSVRDIGTNSRCPGVRCSIPLPASKLQNFDTASTAVVAEPSANICIHVTDDRISI